MIPPRPDNDVQRVAEIRKAGLLNKRLRDLDCKVHEIAADFKVPVCTISIIGNHFQWIKASSGTDLVLTHRDDAFCSYTILDDEVLVIEDTLNDHRVGKNPLVVGTPYIRFYAGAPLHTTSGFKIGALCLIDMRPRQLSVTERKDFQDRALDIEQDLANLSCLHAGSSLVY